MRAGACGLVLALAVLAPCDASSAVRVVATSPALADLARSVGGDRVRVEALMRGAENPHHVVPTPGLVMKLRKADLFVHLGLDAEPWVPTLVRSARRERLLPGAAGNVDASSGVVLREVPARGAVSRAFGDIHVHGNTHYLLDPMNGAIAAGTIAAALVRVDSDGRASYEENLAKLEERLRALAARLTERLRPHRGMGVVVYHRTWPYFLGRFQLEKVAEVEPKPGISPGPQHIADVAARMRAKGVRVLIVETFSNRRIAERVAEPAGARVVVLAQEVDALPDVDSYERLFEYNVEALIDAVTSAAASPVDPSRGQP